MRTPSSSTSSSAGPSMPKPTAAVRQGQQRPAREAPTLVRLCVKSIALNINRWCQGMEEYHLERCRYILTAFDDYALPDHLALQILNQLALRKKLTLSNFVMFLNPGLVQLDLHECGGFITDHFLRQVAKRAVRIRHLNLATCFKITNPALLDLARNLRCLQTVDLSGCNKLQDSALEALVENTGITSLRLAAVNKLGDGALAKAASRLAGLEDLDLSNCPRVTDKSAVLLFDRCPQLRYLKLGGCWEISDASFSRINQQANLEHLDVAVSSIGDDGLQAIMKTCKKLRYLNLEGCANITDDAFMGETTFGEYLETLNLAGCANISEKGLLSLFLDQIICPENLKTLSLPQTLTDNAFVFITNRLLHVTTLSMESCGLITDKAFKTYPLIPLEEVRVLPKNQRFHEMARLSDAIDEGEIPGDNVFPLWAKLKKLNCKGCEKLSDIALACLAFESEEDPKPIALEELILEGCKLITDEGLHHLKNCGGLRVLDVSKCQNITALGVEDLLHGKEPVTQADQGSSAPPKESKATTANTKRKKNKDKQQAEDQGMLVDEEGELPWALLSGSNRELASQILAQQQRRQNTKNRRKMKKRKGAGRSSIVQLKIGGCAHITHIDWEDAKRQFPNVAIAWN